VNFSSTFLSTPRSCAYGPICTLLRCRAVKSQGVFNLNPNQGIKAPEWSHFSLATEKSPAKKWATFFLRFLARGTTSICAARANLVIHFLWPTHVWDSRVGWWFNGWLEIPNHSRVSAWRTFARDRFVLLLINYSATCRSTWNYFRLS